MQTFILARRAETDWSTWGDLIGPDGTALCKILERGARNPDHPRIPAGTYALGRKAIGQSHFDGAFERLLERRYKGILWLPNVPGRTDIEMHTANFVEQLLGCLATGGAIVRDGRRDFAIEGGTSMPTYSEVYAVLSAAIDAGGAMLHVKDIGQA